MSKQLFGSQSIRGTNLECSLNCPINFSSFLSPLNVLAFIFVFMIFIIQLSPKVLSTERSGSAAALSAVRCNRLLGGLTVRLPLS